MKTKIAVFFFSLWFCALAFACEPMGPLFKPQVHGPRMVQHDSSLCYAFSLAHALSIISQQKIDPLFIAYDMQTLITPGSRVDILEFFKGIRPDVYNSQLINTLLVRGLCSSEKNQELAQILQQDILRHLVQEQLDCGSDQHSARDEFRVIHQIYSKLLATVVENCPKEDLLRLQGLRSLSLEIRYPARPEVDAKKAIDSMNKFLDRQKPVVINFSNQLTSTRQTGFHSAVVIARRFNQESQACEYQVLDSSSQEQCELDYDRVLDKSCQQGTYWITASDLGDHAASIISFR